MGDKSVMTDCNSTRHGTRTHSTLELRSSCHILLYFSSCSILERLLSSRTMGGICPYQCILHSLARLDLLGHTPSPRLASSRRFRIDRLSHWQPIFTCFRNACCAHFFQLSTSV